MKNGQVNSLPGLKPRACGKNADRQQGKEFVSDVLPIAPGTTVASDRQEAGLADALEGAEGRGQESVPASEDVYRAIRLKCLECSGDSREEVRLCNHRACPLFAYRLGRQRVAVERSRAGEGPHQGSLLEI